MGGIQPVVASVRIHSRPAAHSVRSLSNATTSAYASLLVPGNRRLACLNVSVHRSIATSASIADRVPRISIMQDIRDPTLNQSLLSATRAVSTLSELAVNDIDGCRRSVNSALLAGFLKQPNNILMKQGKWQASYSVRLSEEMYKDSTIEETKLSIGLHWFRRINRFGAPLSEEAANVIVSQFAPAGLANCGVVWASKEMLMYGYKLSNATRVVVFHSRLYLHLYLLTAALEMPEVHYVNFNSSPDPLLVQTPPFLARLKRRLHLDDIIEIFKQFGVLSV
ncbi:hypothetical protein BASA60_004769 [Batrachochytrium salamandrivorans]|nr:hypothetical protein BASA60_004769 [Batrachochytrium salamandrivorans]